MPVDLDSLLAEAEIEAGIPLRFVVARYPEAQVSSKIETSRPRSVPWSRSELDFVRQNLGVLSLEEIGTHLGRSPTGVKIAQVRNFLPPASKRPGWLTGNQAAILLGIDVHTVCRLTDSGIIPHVIIPGQRQIRAIRYITLLRWAVNPLNWIYFKGSVDGPQRILDPKLRRLIERQKQRWNDEWWTPGQVAACHGVDHTDVNRLIHQGKIKGVKWGNWLVLRSEATKPGLIFCKGKGNTQSLLPHLWSEEAEVFLIQCRAKGMKYKTIARLMKINQRRLQHHYCWLKRHGMISALTEKFGITLTPALSPKGRGEQGEQDLLCDLK